MNRLTKLAGLFGAFVICAGAVPPGKVTQQDLAAIHTIGIVSQLGDQAEIKKVGTIVFGNRTSSLSISD